MQFRSVRPTWKWIRLVLLGCFLVAVGSMSACSIAPREDGNGYVLGVGMTGDGSAEQVGKVAGGLIQSLTGLPIGDAVGGIISTGLGVLGIGGWAAARARKKGSDESWDEAKRDADAQHAKLEAEYYAGKLESERTRGVVHGGVPAGGNLAGAATAS